LVHYIAVTLVEAQLELESVLASDDLKGIPLMVLANKSDSEGSLSSDQVKNTLYDAINIFYPVVSSLDDQHSRTESDSSSILESI